MKDIRGMVRSRTARRFAALLLVYVLLLPVYGPIVDPSFAERLPNHRHVYPNGVVTSHLHSYELDEFLGKAVDVTGVEGGIVVLPGDDGAGPAGLFIALLATLSVAAPALFMLLVPTALSMASGLRQALEPPPPRIPVPQPA